jgi:uncharacterized membrane protein YgcG
MHQQMDDDMQAMEVRDREIERRLEAFARARLSPDPLAVARARARVMREARLQFEAARVAAHLAPSIATVPHRSTARRVAMPLLAASVWLAITVGSISAASAGGPLFNARMWVENVILPSGGVARADAEIARLDTRVAEAVAGAARGDVGAVQAALDAYNQIADEAIAAAAGDPALVALVSAALDHHRAVLTAVAAGLEDRGNENAAAAVEASIQRAIEHNQAVVNRLGSGGAGGGTPGGGSSTGSGGSTGGTGGGSTGGTGTGTGTGGSDSGAGTGGSGSGAGTGAGDHPQKTPKPTPKPTPDPDPSHADQPDRSPRGQNE